MTQGIETMLNLPSLEEVLRQKGLLPQGMSIEATGDEIEASEALTEGDDLPDSDLMRTVEMAQAAQARLDMVEGRDHGEAMDRLHDETLKHARDLMDLGFNVDTPRARGIFEVATAMYGRAIEAKATKRDAQLRSMKLALEQRRLDLDERRIKAQLGEQDSNTIQGEATVIREDRNELIRRIREQRDKER